MVFDTGSVYIRGRHLDKLAEDVQEERIRVLRPFDPEQHEPPAPGEPLIESITLKSRDAIRREIEAEDAAGDTPE